MTIVSTPVRLSLLLALLACAACPGTLADPDAFDLGAGDGGTNGPVATADAAPAASACPDVPTVLAQSCGTAGCHDATTRAEGLDLKSPDVASRLVGVPAVEGAGFLIDRATPAQSVVYTKLLATPPFGLRMPTVPLDDATTRCVLDWVTAEASAVVSPADGGAPFIDAASPDASPLFTTLRVAAGQTSPVTDAQGNVWSADVGFTGGTAAGSPPSSRSRARTPPPSTTGSATGARTSATSSRCRTATTR